MAIDPRTAQMAEKMRAARLRQPGRVVRNQMSMQQSAATPADISEQPQNDAAIIAEAKTLLQKAMELLASIGTGSEEGG